MLSVIFIITVKVAVGQLFFAEIEQKNSLRGAHPKPAQACKPDNT